MYRLRRQGSSREDPCTYESHWQNLHFDSPEAEDHVGVAHDERNILKQTFLGSLQQETRNKIDYQRESNSHQG